MALNILTLNVNGLRDANKRAGLLMWLSNLSVSFVVLQETHVSSCSEADSWFCRYGFQVVASPGSLRSCGTVVLYRPIFHLCKVQRDNDGRFVLCEFSYHDRLFRICGVYAPNCDPDRGDFFHFVINAIDPSAPMIICGDFNAVFDRAIDCGGLSTPNVRRNDSVPLTFLFHECLFWMFGAHSTPLNLVSRGVAQTALCCFRLIILAVLIHGPLLYCLVIFTLVLGRITVLCFLAFPYRIPSPRVLAGGI